MNNQTRFDVTPLLDMSGPLADSFCLYQSSKYNEDLHLKPFCEHLENTDVPSLVFHTDFFTNKLPQLPHVHCFEVQQLEGYKNQCDRYLGAWTNYDMVRFKGTDIHRPVNRPFIDRLTPLMEMTKYQFCCSTMECFAPPPCLSGSCILNGKGKLRQAFREFPVSNFGAWTSDGCSIFDWVLAYEPSLILWMPHGVQRKATRELVDTRLQVMTLKTLIIGEGNINIFE